MSLRVVVVLTDGDGRGELVVASAMESRLLVVTDAIAVRADLV